MKKVYIYLAEGFEEIEALAPADILRRAGAQVTLVSVSSDLLVTGARGIKAAADCTLKEAGELPDMIVLPGGYPGYENLANSAEVEAMVKRMLEDNRFVAAICGAPAAVLGEKGFLKDSCAVCYPGMEDKLFCRKVSSDGVCADGNIITAKSAGYAIEFALKLTECLFGKDEMKKVSDGIVYNG